MPYGKPWWENNKYFGNYMGRYNPDRLRSFYNKRPIVGGLDYSLDNAYSQSQLGTQKRRGLFPNSMEWMWRGAKPGEGNASTRPQDTRAKMNMLKSKYSWLFPGGGDLTNNQLNTIMPPIATERTADLFRMAPDPSKIPADLMGPVQESYDTYEKLHRLGYFPTPGYAFNPAMGSLGGVGPKDFRYLDNASMGANSPGIFGYPSAQPGDNLIPANTDMTPYQQPTYGGRAGKGTVPQQATGGVYTIDVVPDNNNDVVTTNPGGQPAVTSGGTTGTNLSIPTWDYIQENDTVYNILGQEVPHGSDPADGVYFVKHSDGTTEKVVIQDGKITNRNVPGAEEPDNPFNDKLPQEVPMSPGAQRNMALLDTVPQQLMNQYMTMANQGIYGIPGLQTIFNAGINPVLGDLKKRTPEILNSIRQGESLTRSNQARQLTDRMGARGVAMPGMANQMIADKVTTPSLGRQANLTSNLMSMMGEKSDALKMQRGEYVAENMRSKERGLSGMGSTTNLIANMMGSRYWDTTMRNKYGWTPYESGWVNAELKRLQHKYNLTEQEARYRFEKALQDAQGGGFFDTLGNMLDIGGSIAALL